MIVLWMIGVLSVLVLSVIQPATNAQADAILRAKQVQARCYAETGLVIALHPEVGRFDPLLSRRDRGDEGNGYQAVVTGEAGRFGINSILDQTHMERCSRLLRVLGLKFEESEALADALADWIDPDDLRRLNGAERAEYLKQEIQGAPANRPFGSVEEMRAVIGMDRLEEVRPDWRIFFSTLNDARIDVNFAEPEIIKAVVDLGDNRIERLLAARAGPDRIPETSDDVVIKDFASFERIVGGLNTAERQRLQPVLLFESPARRVVSTGYFEESEFRLELVAVPGVPARVLSWEKL